MKVTRTTIMVASIATITILAVWSIASGRQASTTTAEIVPSPASSPSGNQTQTNENGNVTVTVTPQELSVGKPATFQIVYDTHSINLDFDVASVAELRDDQNNSYGMPVWNGDPPGGHHRKGALTFPTPLGKTTQIMLTLKNIAGIKERVFAWNL
ncbi:hypothetical protein HY032_02090 [Candidatus Gottesmanbacteria bacterium]|nr:hypothetical protein [Candidatus Gottesmanbacteria bacterium]